MEEINVFIALEKLLNEKIPMDIKTILTRSAYDSKTALSCVNDQLICSLEQYANQDRSILKDTSYENMTKFVFKPGHRTTILHLADKVKSLENETDENKQQRHQTEFSFILKTLIETAESNSGRDPRGYRYNDVNRNFSTLVYLLCGRACYEFLSSNLPMPQADTIRKFF